MRSWSALSVRRALHVVRRPGLPWLLLLEAAGWLGIARACVLLMPYRWVVALLSLRDWDIGPSKPGEAQGVIESVTRAIATASRHTPWHNNCLARAIATKVMLRRRRVASTLYLGVRVEDGALTAHAWLKCDRAVPTGNDGPSNYTVVWTSGEGVR